MKKKFLIMVLLFSAILGGCGNSGASRSAAADDMDAWEEDSTEYEETDMEYEETAAEDESDTYEAAVTKKYQFHELNPFSEERAWVKYVKDGTLCTGIIDVEGNVLYEAESDYFYMSQFQDGLTFYVEQESGSSCGIIDANGNVLYESQITSEGGYQILAYGNGHFLVKQHIENYDINEWQYGTIDKNGKILNEMKADDSVLGVYGWGVGCEYIGEGFIELSNYELYHIPTSTIAPLPFGVGIIGDFYEGYTLLNVNSDVVAINADFRGKKEGKDLEETEGIVAIFNDGGNTVGRYQEGLVLRDRYVLGGSETFEHGYYDKDNRLVISLEPYRDKNVKGGDFCGGYAPLVLKGADEKDYASVIDTSGNMAYKPVRIDYDHYNSIYDSLSAAGGYLQVTIDEKCKIIGKDGTIYTPGVDDLSMMKGISLGKISNGFIMMTADKDNPGITPYYISLDTQIMIDSAKVTSTDMDAVGRESWDDETSEDASYIIPDSYDITGKWKSVGESGFGQAQPGAIVIFDGNRCNFYSPSDTYAFYFDGDKYVLNLTSLLGESLERTVYIIDGDNIKVAGIRLKRVE